MFSLENFLISSAKENLTRLNMAKSPINAPKPPINQDMRIFCSFDSISKIAVAGAAVNP